MILSNRIGRLSESLTIAISSKAKELKAEETKKEEHIREVEFLPEEQKTKKRDFIEVEGRPLDRKQLEDEAIITINPIAGQSDSEE